MSSLEGMVIFLKNGEERVICIYWKSNSLFFVRIEIMFDVVF